MKNDIEVVQLMLVFLWKSISNIELEIIFVDKK